MDHAAPKAWSSFAQTIIETSTSPVVIFDSSGAAVFANDAAGQLLGLPPRRLVGRPAEDSVFGTPDSSFSLQADGERQSPFAAAREAGAAVSGLRCAVAPVGGGLKHVVVDAIPLWTELGSLAGVAVTYSDRTRETAALDDAEWMRRDIEDHRRQEEEQLRLAAQLNVIAGLVMSADMVDRALSEARDAIEADGAVLALLDGNGTLSAYGTGWTAFAAADLTRNDGKSLGLRAADSNEAIALENVAAGDPAYADLDRADEIKSLIVAPLKAKDFVGAVYLLYQKDSHPVSTVEMDFAARLGYLLSLLLENRRLVEDLDERNRLNAEYARVAESLHSTLDADEVVKRALEEGRAVLGAQTATICLRAEDGMRCLHESGWSGESILGKFFPDEQDVHGLLAVAERCPIAINDALNDERMPRELAEKYGLRSVVVAPLVMRGDVFATVYFNYHDEPHVFSNGEIGFVERLASSLSLALDNARLFASEADLLRDSAVAQRVLSIATRRTDLQSLAREILATLQEELGLVAGAIYAYDPEEQALNMIDFSGYAQAAADEIRRVSLDQDLPVARVVRERFPYLTSQEESVSETARILFRSLGIEGQRWITLALPVGDHVVGTMGLVFDGDRPFTNGEIRLYRLVANQLAMAFERIRLLETESQARDLAATELASSTALLRVSFVLSQFTSVDGVCAALAEALLTATSHTRVCVWLSGGAPGELVLAAAAGQQTPPTGAIMHVPPAVLRLEDHSWRSELLEPEESTHERLERGIAPRLGLVLPLIRASETLGHVTVDSPDSPEPFEMRERELLEAAVAQGAIALTNALMLERERTSRELNEALRDMNEMLLSSTDLSKSFPQILEEASAGISADMALLALAEGESWVVSTSLGFDSDMEGRRFTRSSATALTLATEDEEPLFLEDTEHDPRANAAFANRTGMRSYVVVPLRARQLVQAVAVFGFRQRRAFGANEHTFAERFGASMTLALENAELLRERTEEARLNLKLGKIQTALLTLHDDSAVWDRSLREACAALDCTGAGIVREVDDEPRLSFTTGTLVTELSQLSQALSSEQYQIQDWVSWSLSDVMKNMEADESNIEITHATLVALPRADERPGGRTGLLLQRHHAFSAHEIAFARRVASTIDIAVRDARLLKDREALAQAREEWLSGVSHDLRTPLAAVRGYAHLLASQYETPPEEVRRESSLILDQTDKIERMIQDMLFTFRIRAGALPVNLEDVDVHEALEDVARTLGAYEEVAAEAISVARPNVPVHARVDPELFERALMNLGRNAVVHNPLGTELRFAARKDGDCVVVTVSDNGRGMDEELLGHIFVRYERGSASSEGAGGMGLGMPIARQLVEAMGGSLHVESEVGVGTTVTIRVPAAGSTPGSRPRSPTESSRRSKPNSRT